MEEKNMESTWSKGPPSWLTKEPEVSREDAVDGQEEDEEEVQAEEQEQEKQGLPLELARMLKNAINILMGGDKVHPMADLLQEFLNRNKPAPSLEDKEKELRSLEDRCKAPNKNNSRVRSMGRKISQTRGGCQGQSGKGYGRGASYGT